MRVPRVIKLMADYQCHPLWADGGNVDPASLPLTEETQQALTNWAKHYDSTLNWDDPAMSGFASEAEERDFEAEGQRLCDVLREELGESARVVYVGERAE